MDNAAAAPKHIVIENYRTEVYRNRHCIITVTRMDHGVILGVDSDPVGESTLPDGNPWFGSWSNIPVYFEEHPEVNEFDLRQFDFVRARDGDDDQDDGQKAVQEVRAAGRGDAAG